MKRIVNAKAFIGSAMKFKKVIRESIPYVNIERALLYTESYKENSADEFIVRRAKAFAHVLENQKIKIFDEEIFAGNMCDTLFSAPLFPEYSVRWWIEDLKRVGDRTFDKFFLSQEDYEKLLPVIGYWDGKTLQDHATKALTKQIVDAEYIGVSHGAHIMSEGYGHLIVDYDKVVRIGIEGIEAQIKNRLARIDYLYPEDIEKKPFLESTLIVCKAIREYAQRYSRLASEMAQTEQDEERRLQLLDIAENCARVPYKPAENFMQALQSAWFIQLLVQMESSGHSISLGRFDQYMYPYMKRDIEAGDLNKEQAEELVKHFWCKLNCINKIRAWEDTQFQAGYPMYQNITIGGQTPDGFDAVNDLTYLCLNATKELMMTQPSLAARYYSGSSQEYLMACGRTIRVGLGMPAMQNDEGIIPSLLNRGIVLEDARNYAMVGCIEPSIPAKFGYRCNGMSQFSLAKVFELTLNDGVDPETGITVHPGEGKFEDMGSFEELYAAFIRQVRVYNEIYIRHDNVADIYTAKYVPDSLTSMLVDDCIERGKSLGDGGAVYDIISGQTSGLANVSNSLAAIKKLVFEDGTLSKAELMAALKDNFTSSRGQEIRKMLLDVPKYGNDDPYVDDIAKQIFIDHAHCLDDYKNARYGKGPIHAGWQVCTSTVTANVPMGSYVGALPDGRKANTPVADGVSPTQGTDVCGPTASMNSVGNLPNELISGGQLYNMKFPTEMFSDEEKGVANLVSLLRGYFRKKGLHVQFNVIDPETLRAAQLHPEEYKDLVVRVAGYSAYFVDVSKEVQNDIINRTEHCF